MTAPQKQYKKDSALLQTARNRALVEHATKKITTYGQMLVHAGHLQSELDCYYSPTQLNKPISRQDILDHYAVFESRLQAKRDGVGEKYSTLSPASYEFEGVLYELEPTQPAKVIGPDKKTIVLTDSKGRVDTDDEQLNEYERLPDSPHRKARLFPFQERASTALFHGIINKHHRAMLLRAAVGTGKTYIVAAVADCLRNMKFCEGKTFSPWPVVYVNKATIIEQTERVLRDHFGLDVNRDIKVINIEQLRASFGELMVRCETVVFNGEEKLIWKWREGLHPLIFFFDECQILKNDDSQQSQIVQSIADLPHPNIHMIFFSATPFLRVIDTKCFVLNARIETTGIAI